MKTILQRLFLLCIIAVQVQNILAYDFEVDGIYYNILSGNRVEVTYGGEKYRATDSYTGGIAIPSTIVADGVSYSVTSIGEYAFNDCSWLTSIDIPDGVTSIGNFAFFGCRGLTSITIPDGVTSIGNGTFSDCGGLTSIEMPNGVTSIGFAAFSGCSGLISITIPDGVTSIGHSAFYGCRALTSITIPNGVTSIGLSAFAGCYGLISINIPDGVTSIGSSSFYHCIGLTGITIPRSVTAVGDNAFSGCTNLKQILIESSTTSSAKDKTRAASATQTTIGAQAFANCTELTTAVLSDQVTIIGNEVFLNDSKLRIIYLLSTTPPSLGADWIEGVADDCVIYVPEGSEDDYKEAGLSGHTVKGCDVTGINAVESVADDTVSVYGLDGKCLYSGKQGEMHLGPGLYVVKSATSVRKIVVK